MTDGSADTQNKPSPRTSESVRRACATARSRVDPSRRASVDERADSVPKLYRFGYLTAAGGTASPRDAIKAHCLECVCWQREEVIQCTALACPLYAYRPFQDKEEEDINE